MFLVPSYLKSDSRKSAINLGINRDELLPPFVRGKLEKKKVMEMSTKLQKCRTVATALNHLGRTKSLHLHHFHRRFLHEGPDTVEELVDRHLVKKDKKDSEEDELLTRQRLTSTHREALSLYRDIIRATRFFMWPDSRGVLWRDVLRENARKEFEEARFEKDPEIVTRLLIGGRDAVQSALDKLFEKQKQQIEKEKNEFKHR